MSEETRGPRGPRGPARLHAGAFHAAVALMVLGLPLLSFWSSTPVREGDLLVLRSAPRDPWHLMTGQYMVLRPSLGELDCRRIDCDPSLFEFEGERPRLMAFLAPAESGYHEAVYLTVQGAGIPEGVDEPLVFVEDWSVDGVGDDAVVRVDLRLNYSFSEGTQDEHTPAGGQELAVWVRAHNGRLTPVELELRTRGAPGPLSD